jgi:exosortase
MRTEIVRVYLPARRERLPAAQWPLIALVLAFWPVWSWLAGRVGDDGSEYWGLLALATAGFLLWRERVIAGITARGCGGVSQSSVPWLVIAALVLVYAVSYPFVPPLVRAIVAMTALAIAGSSVWLGRRLDVRLWGFLLLALPLISSLNFYLGFPLRAAVGEAAAMLLQMNGFAVVREGTTLAWNERQISIDAPCSGVKMLWTGMYLTCALAVLWRLDTRRTAILGVCAVVIVLAANVLRTTALFYVEAGTMPEAGSVHTLIGAAVFVLACIAIALMAARLRDRAYAT